MLDALGILSSSLAILYVIWRAWIADRTVPWFETEESPEETPETRHQGQISRRTNYAPNSARRR